jgi:predicted nucleic acid-binding protein
MRMKWTRQWWDEYAVQFELTTSAAVIEELEQGASEKVQERLDLLQDVELLPINDQITNIVKKYIENRLMPNDPTGDALHLAVASFHRVDALLTWNCKHLANANKTKHIRKINDQLGLPTPELTTPLNYLGGDD